MKNPVNPEAGDVPFPTDVREIELAEYSARIIWRACPYFQLRYAERGRRFGASDVGYLIVIASSPESVFFDQIDWLARVLAGRGMPSCLLELQLRILAKGGAQRNWPGTEKALAGADRLLAERRRWLSDAQEKKIIAMCEESSVFESRNWNIGLGMLLACAVADNDAGITSSTEPLFGWLLSQQTTSGSMADIVSQVRDFLAREKES